MDDAQNNQEMSNIKQYATMIFKRINNLSHICLNFIKLGCMKEHATPFILFKQLDMTSVHLKGRVHSGKKTSCKVSLENFYVLKLIPPSFQSNMHLCFQTLTYCLAFRRDHGIVKYLVIVL